MAEYIEKDAILSKCEEMWSNADETTQTGVDTINAIDKITDFIEAMPVADVQSIKCGRWILDSDENFVCSQCRHPRQIGAKDFCGKCGARMMKDSDTNGRFD